VVEDFVLQYVQTSRKKLATKNVQPFNNKTMNHLGNNS
jgi:hypothetical protein